MPRLPIEYEVELSKIDGDPMELRSGHRAVILGTPPPEFGGSDMHWSPEHLLVSAAASCMTATFLSMTSRASIHIGEVRVAARGTLGRTESNPKVMFTELTLAFTVRALHDDVARIQKLFDDAKGHCFVANSLACPVKTTLTIQES